MKAITLDANAKINLTLDVLGKRPDGYHDVRTILQEIDLSDEVCVAIDTGEWSCTCDDAAIPGGEDNLAMRAARAYLAAVDEKPDGVSIRIKKRIPSQAGLGGGSADAAAVLRALNELYGCRFSANELLRIGAAVGSDVPFCVLGGTALAEGRGERLTPLPPAPDCSYLLVKPSFSASTAELYARLDETEALVHPDTEGMIESISRRDLLAVAGKLCNVFQPVLNADHPVDRICRKLTESGAAGACLTGSGSVVFGIHPGNPAPSELEKLHAALLSSGIGDFRCYSAKNVQSE